MLLVWILGFSLLGSLGAVGGAALLLAFPDEVRQRLVPALIAYAAGALLGAAFLGMIPAAAGDAPVRAVSAAVLAGIVLFFLLERLVLWRHGHEAGSSSNPAAPLILVGDAFHNFVDGDAAGPAPAADRELAPACAAPGRRRYHRRISLPALSAGLVTSTSRPGGSCDLCGDLHRLPVLRLLEGVRCPVDRRLVEVLADQH